MSADRAATGGLLVAMVAVAAVAWWFQLRPPLDFDASRLAALPHQLGDWSGRDVPLESAAERILRADLNLQRVYTRRDTDELVWLYVGYYGTQRGGRPEHTPGVCYPSAGWRIEERGRWPVDPRGQEGAVEFVISREGYRRLAHFWYQSSRSSGLLGTWSVSVDQLASRLSSGRADGALVRVSTPIADDGLAAARARIAAFRRELAPELASRWPSETPRR